MTRWISLVFGMSIACASSKGGESKGEAKPPAPAKIGPVAIAAKSGAPLSGSVTLMAVEGGVEVHVMVEGAPAGKHGAHIHEKGDCSADDASSAGGHFNPKGVNHALPEGGGDRHLGDLGNLTVGEDGKGELKIVAQGASLDDMNEMSFKGKALIIHEKEDDGGQPTGNAGGRIGCAAF
jgi:Cu-Zn family superoxide dismutase